jgi:hypothetical protein
MASRSPPPSKRGRREDDNDESHRRKKLEKGKELTAKDVTPSFKGKTECVDHVCARIKLHTHLDIMNTKNSATRIKSYYNP